MVNPSSRQVFSTIYNINSLLKTNKELKNINIVVSSIHWNKQPEFIKKICSEIRTYLLNSYYSYQDLMLYIFDSYIRGNKFKWSYFKTKDIIDVSNTYKTRQYENDKKFVLSIKNEIGLNNIDDYFSINKDGYSYIYMLIEKGYVNPIFYLRLVGHLDISFESECVEHKRFRTIIEYIRQYVNV
jgi:hypothetical protein